VVAGDALSALASPPPYPKRRRLLIADACAETRRFIRSALAGLFADIVESCDGRSLFWTLESNLRAANGNATGLLVIANLRMPVYSGLQALEAWREVERSLSFIVFSTFPSDEERVRAHAMGALLLPKPFSAVELCRVVDALA
jgi:CheY-like chemotaxis protein